MALLPLAGLEELEVFQHNMALLPPADLVELDDLEVLEVRQNNMALLLDELEVAEVFLPSTVLPLPADLEVLEMVLLVLAQLEVLEVFLRSMVLLGLAGLGVPTRNTLPAAAAADTTMGVEVIIQRKILCP